MKPGLEIWRCAGCGHAMFPERVMCPRCHGGDFVRATARTAVVEEVSTIHHMIGQENWRPRRIASVLTDAGCRITAGLLDEAGEGEEIELSEENGAPFGRRGAGKR
jgi:uncharacterized OB-fold protein